jgi:putative endonuclease
MKTGCVYIMANRKNGAIYIGATGDLVKRAWEHRNGLVRDSPSGTAASCWCGSKPMTILRNRAWKIRLIEETNFDWDDLYPRLF